MEYHFNELVDRKGTDCLKWDHNQQTYGSESIHPMWVADMDFKAPPPVLDAMRARLEHGVFGYTFRSDAYLGIIRDWVGRRYNWPVKPGWITHSPGVVPALALSILANTRPGDRVMIMTPVYPPFFGVVRDNGRSLIECPLNNDHGFYSIDFDRMEAMIDKRTRMLMFCNPHNPAGRVWTVSELEKIGEIALRHNLIMISDEIHADFIFSKHKHVPIASLSPELSDRTITCYAPSKTFGMAGLNTSYAVISNQALRQNYNDLLEGMDLDGGNIFGLTALMAAYTGCDDWLAQLIVHLEGNRDHAVSFLRERVPAIEAASPEGTYLLWLNCEKLGFSSPKELDGFFIRQAALGLNRGLPFGSQCGQFMRLNFGCPRPLLDMGLRQLEKAVYERLRLR